MKRIGVVNSGDPAGRAEETSRGKKTITAGHADDEAANADGDDDGGDHKMKEEARKEHKTALS